MERNNLDGIKKVKFLDYSEYNSEKCNNGGRYGFWTEYIRISDERWEVTHGTTADLIYCPVCGSFSDHYDGDDSVFDSGYSCGEFSTVTTEELLKFINEFEETDDQYIKYIPDNTKHGTDSKVCTPAKSFS